MQDTRVFGFNFDIALIGLDLSDHIARLHRLAVLFEPLKKGTLFHGIAHFRHDHFRH